MTGLKTIGVKVKVDDGIGDKTIGVWVGEIVGVTVGTEGGAMAVCVWKTDSTTVPTAMVRMLLRSGVGNTSFCPPQETSSNPRKIIKIMECRTGFIFTFRSS